MKEKGSCAAFWSSTERKEPVRLNMLKREAGRRKEEKKQSLCRILAITVTILKMEVMYDVRSEHSSAACKVVVRFPSLRLGFIVSYAAICHTANCYRQSVVLIPVYALKTWRFLPQLAPCRRSFLFYAFFPSPPPAIPKTER